MRIRWFLLCHDTLQGPIAHRSKVTMSRAARQKLLARSFVTSDGWCSVAPENYVLFEIVGDLGSVLLFSTFTIPWDLRSSRLSRWTVQTSLCDSSRNRTRMEIREKPTTSPAVHVQFSKDHSALRSASTQLAFTALNVCPRMVK